MNSIFVQKTKDTVEQLYGPEIIKLFPNYSIFWEEFIGDPKKVIPVAYGLLFPSSMKKRGKSKLRRFIMRSVWLTIHFSATNSQHSIVLCFDFFDRMHTQDSLSVMGMDIENLFHF